MNTHVGYLNLQNKLVSSCQDLCGSSLPGGLLRRTKTFHTSLEPLSVDQSFTMSDLDNALSKLKPAIFVNMLPSSLKLYLLNILTHVTNRLPIGYHTGILALIGDGSVMLGKRNTMHRLLEMFEMLSVMPKHLMMIPSFSLLQTLRCSTQGLPPIPDKRS